MIPPAYHMSVAMLRELRISRGDKVNPSLISERATTTRAAAIRRGLIDESGKITAAGRARLERLRI